MSDVKLPQFPMGVQVSGEDMIPAAQNGTSGLIKVKDVRNIGSTIEEGGTEKTASNENLKTVNTKVDELSQSVDSSFQTVNQNFLNVEGEIQSANTAIDSANQNIGNHETDTGLHVTPEKQSKWDGYATQLSEMLKQYKGFTAVNSTYSETTPIVDLVTNMSNNSMLVADVLSNSVNVYPVAYGTIRITKISMTRIVLEFMNFTGSQWLATYHSSNGFSGWKQIATTETATLTLLNGWVMNYLTPKVARSGSISTINMRIAGGVTTSGTIISTISAQYRPVSAIYIPVTNVNGVIIGSIGINESGNIYVVSAITNNTDVNINVSYYLA